MVRGSHSADSDPSTVAYARWMVCTFRPLSKAFDNHSILTHHPKLVANVAYTLQLMFDGRPSPRCSIVLKGCFHGLILLIHDGLTSITNAIEDHIEGRSSSFSISYLATPSKAGFCALSLAIELFLVPIALRVMRMIYKSLDPRDLVPEQVDQNVFKLLKYTW